MPRGTCGQPSPGHPFRRGCGLGPQDLNEWGICQLCALDNGEGMRAVEEAIAEKERAWFENDEAWSWHREAYEGADQ